MSGVVSRMEDFVRERIAMTWPDLVCARVEARPLFDLSLGDFGIDCCLEIGAALKQRPEDVAGEFVGQLPVHPEFSFVALEGFINVTLRNPERLCGEGRLAPRVGTERHRIIVSPPTPDVSANGFVRLLGSALIQTSLVRSCGGVSELFIGAERCEGTSIAELFRAGLRCGVESERLAARRALESQLTDDIVDRATVWISPCFLERGDFRDFYRRHFAAQSRFTLRCPARAWVEGFQESWWQIATRSKKLTAVALMVASSRAPTELDEYSLELAEQGNLRWFLESTLRRLERLPVKWESESPQQMVDLSTLVRRLVLRIATIGWFERGAAVRGEIPEWIDALTDLLRVLNVWMNAPQTRRGLESGTISLVEREILSGARKAVSDIMRSNPLFYEVDSA